MSWLGKNSGGKEIFLVFQGVCSSMKHLWELLFTSSIHAGSVEKSGFLAIDGVAFSPSCGSGIGCFGHIWTRKSSEPESVFPENWIQLQIPLECVIYKFYWTYSWASKNFQFIYFFSNFNMNHGQQRKVPMDPDQVISQVCELLYLEDWIRIEARTRGFSRIEYGSGPSHARSATLLLALYSAFFTLQRCYSCWTIQKNKHTLDGKNLQRESKG